MKKVKNPESKNRKENLITTSEQSDVKMTKTKEDYAGMNAKMTYAKGSVTRSCNAIESLCVKLEGLLGRDKEIFPEKQQRNYQWT